MNAALAGITGLLSSPWLDTILVLGITITVLGLRRSHSVDEHTRQHRESDECPWCAASDERLLERERQQWRADIAKRNREAAERRMRGAS